MRVWFTTPVASESGSGENATSGLCSVAFALFRETRGIAIGDQAPETNPVFTIGHSNHSTERFFGLLKKYGIEAVVDTRSHPYSRHAPRFNASSLEAALSKEGFEYLFLGEELGGRPRGGEYYDDIGRVDYALVGCSRPFLDGISRLEKEIRARTVVLLCSEENPARCHRRLLVGRALEELGFTLRHIRGDGSIQIEGETNSGQPVLFPESEASPRKSIRSASRKRRHPSSSER
jgi:uncharacterized protein (DUF488 family)